MNNLIAVLYGVLQGITEFLPVSSSAHLALLPHFLHFKDPGVFFDLSMHVGTALAIGVYFWRDIHQLLLDLMSFIFPQFQGSANKFLALNMIYSVGGTGFFFIFLKGWAEQYGRSPIFIAINLVIFGFLLLLADLSSESEHPVMQEQKSWKQALIIGIAQTLAIFPGVSRSGITITAARFMRLSRVEASKYSFLLALPPIFAGIILKYKESLVGEHLFQWQHLFIGTSISFVVAIATIHFFLRWIKQVGFKLFFFYRLLLAIMIYILVT